MRCVAPNDVRTEPTPMKRLHHVGYKRYFTTTYWKENRLLGGYVLVFIFAQLLMIIIRACQLKDFKNQDGSTNFYYIIARATGRFLIISFELKCNILLSINLKDKTVLKNFYSLSQVFVWI